MAEKRLLIVDDVVAMGEFVRTVGKSLGYEVRLSTCGEEFKRVVDEFDPTTVMLDIMMPDIDGLQLVKWLRERGCAAKIIVASMENPNYAKLARALGKGRGLDISVLPKPYNVNQLYEALA